MSLLLFKDQLSFVAVYETTPNHLWSAETIKKEWAHLYMSAWLSNFSSISYQSSIRDPHIIKIFENQANVCVFAVGFDRIPF